MSPVFNGNLFLKLSFFLLLVVGVMLPSDGGHGLLSPKSLCFVMAMGAWGVHLLFNPMLSAFNQRLLLFLMLTLSIMMFWTIWGAENGSSAIEQFKLFFITIFFTCLAAYSIETKAVSFASMVKVAIYANFVYSSIKISIAILHALHIVNFLSIMEKLGFRFMSMQIMGDVGRLQTSVDILTPFLLYFVLTSQFWKIEFFSGFKKIYLPLTWLSIAFSFSRFLFFCGMMAHIMFWLTEKEKPLALSLFKFVMILMVLVPLAGPERIYHVVEKRFFSVDNVRSDDVREDQINALMETFEDVPLFGKGMGGYSEKVIRDHRLKYSYEVQWVSFLMQFGLIGIFMLSLPLFFIIYMTLKPPFSVLKLSLFAMFTLWLFAGFTNPFLISLPSGIVYALFFGSALQTSDALNTKIC